MPKTNQSWKILPHGLLSPLTANVLTVNGMVYWPFERTRRMTVVRLSGGRVAIFNPIALRDTELSKIEALGLPTYLIVPGKPKLDDLLVWQVRYPWIALITSTASQTDATSSGPVRSSDLRDPCTTVVEVPGTGGRELAMLVREPSGDTLVVNDLLFNLPRKRGAAGALMRGLGFGPGPAMPWLVSNKLIRDKNLVVDQLTSWARRPNLKHLVMSHGEPIENPRGTLRALALHMRGTALPASSREPSTASIPPLRLVVKDAADSEGEEVFPRQGGSTGSAFPRPYAVLPRGRLRA